MGFFGGMLGLIDLLAATALFLVYFEHPFNHLQAGIALALMMKGVLFIGDILSLIDIAIGILMFALFWMDAPLLALSAGIWLVYKGLYAWF